MKIIFGNPGSGKTKALLELSAKNNIPVLCESAARVQRLLVKAEGYGYKWTLSSSKEEEPDKMFQKFVNEKKLDSLEFSADSQKTK